MLTQIYLFIYFSKIVVTQSSEQYWTTKVTKNCYVAIKEQEQPMEIFSCARAHLYFPILVTLYLIDYISDT